MIEKLKNRKLTTRLFSVLLAIILWLFLIHTVNPQITQRVNNVQVTFKGLDVLKENGLIPVNIEKSCYVDVTIRGQRTGVIKALSEITAVADLSSVSVKGTRIENVNIDTGVAGVYVDGRGTPTITVEIDEIDVKTIPVEIVHTGSEKNKQTIAVSNTTQKQITLNGAKSELDTIEKAVVSINASDVDKKETVMRNFIFYDKDGSKVVPDTVKSDINTVEVTTGLYPRKSLPVRISLPDEYKDKFTIEYTLKSKENVDVGIVALDTNVEEIVAEFDPMLYRVGTAEYRIEMKEPDGIFIPDTVRFADAEIKILETETKKVNLDIEMRNVKDGLMPDSDTYKVELEVTGPKEKVEEGGFKAYIDAANLNEGQHEVVVKLESHDNIKIIEEKKIMINLKKQEG